MTVNDPSLTSRVADPATCMSNLRACRTHRRTNTVTRLQSHDYSHTATARCMYPFGRDDISQRHFFYDVSHALDRPASDADPIGVRTIDIGPNETGANAKVVGYAAGPTDGSQHRAPGVFGGKSKRGAFETGQRPTPVRDRGAGECQHIPRWPLVAMDR